MADSDANGAPKLREDHTKGVRDEESHVSRDRKESILWGRQQWKVPCTGARGELLLTNLDSKK